MSIKSLIFRLVVEEVVNRLEDLISPLIKTILQTRYFDVDSMLITIKRNVLKSTHNSVNNVFHYLKFTMEMQVNN